jgi:ribosomal protein S18 acetylase RimI-like enzyme
MPRIADAAVIRAILERDRPWSVYALGDLSPGFAEHCEWFVLEGNRTAIILLYRRVDPPILFALGSPDHLARLVAETDAPAADLQVRTDALPALVPHYRSIDVRPMWRMIVHPQTFRSVPVNDASRLGAADVDAIVKLYADGDEQGEAPNFFHPYMVAQGIFWGVREGAELVSVAGTHLVARLDGVCAVGNVYTRRDRRGHGLAASVMSGVVADAFRDRVTTVVLNVGFNNAAAIGLYERLGFSRYCDFAEGSASR